MAKKLIIILLTTLVSISSFAKQVTIADAQRVAVNFFYERINQSHHVGYNEIKVSEQYSFPGIKDPAYYIFNMADRGFVIVSSDDRVVPVLGYSFETACSAYDQPPQFVAWMKQYEDQIRDVIQNNLPAAGKITEQWAHLRSADPLSLTPFRDQRQVQPLLISTWNQDIYYNGMCPPVSGGPGGRAYAGCVPTAMGQIMYYYRWPDHGVGAYTDQDPQFGPLHANFDSTWYNWNNMTNNLSRSNPGIAELLYHVGISCDLVYGADGSGMFNHKAAYALRTFFRYSPQCQYLFRDSTNLDWDSVIVAHLDRKMPLYYAGWSVPNIVGHAFVCDGYQDTAYFHFNWGWGSSSDGYFYLNNLNPGGSNFNLAQELVINFYPDTINYSYERYCTGSKTLNYTDGSLDDGSGVFANYSGNSACTWLIDPQTQQDSVSRIKLTFGRMDTNPADFISVYDGPFTTSPLLGSFSGNNVPSFLTSSGNKMLVTFNSASGGSGSGWDATYAAELPVFCNGTTMTTADTAELTDGSLRFNYQPKINCRWIIDPVNQNGRPLTVYFKSFDTEEGNDILTIHDYMDDNTAHFLAKISGHYEPGTLPDSVTSPSGKMYIIFISNSTVSGQGWELYYPYRKPSGIEETPGFHSMNVFPNPASQKANLSLFNENAGKITIRIVNINGIVLSSATENAGSGWFKKEIDLSGLPGGIYSIQVMTNKKTSTNKLVVY